MSWRFGMMITGAVALLFTLGACQPVSDARTTNAASEKTLFVGPEMVDCVGVGPQQCMLVKENPGDEYQFFYSRIDGFEYEPGYTYELRVLVEPVENAPADASSLKYTLIEVVSKEPVMADAADVETAETGSLAGPTWLLTGVADASGAFKALPDGVEATATFADDRVSGGAGCNNYNAAYTLDGDSLTILPGPMTMMACPALQMNVEQQFMAALSATATYQIANGELALLGADGQVMATFTVQESVGLTGVTWVATSYNNGRGAAVSILADTEITAIFDAAGEVGGSAGCNRYFSSYTVEDALIAIQPAASTRKLCPEPIMEQEYAYLSALPTVATFAIQGDQLELRTADGALVAAYRASGE
ncbi:META domain-containing protein [Caldilinea sp.]|uniref:META domain-containing protein n=1 Tax=Caldilinea sp. TaxID=2293560 RepID=UPI002CBDB177|nr:META domain-containing protein [Anaerolineales bacterium]HQY91879.1 META domain-containing protein [Caldilinea sp.]HRA64741.1 META domain-containing protein [Caldilinea sp.]